MAKSSADASLNTPTAMSGRFDARRVYTAALLIPAIYVIIRYLPSWGFTLLIGVAGCMALYELYRMTFGERNNLYLVALGLVTTAAIIGRTHLALPLADLVTAGTLGAVVAMLFLATPLPDRFKDATVTVFGMLYIGMTLSALVSTRALPSGEWLVLFLAVVTWAGDIGAYYVGSLWGRHRLAPSLSPKKSAEGLVGGTAFAIVAALLAQRWALPLLSVMDALLLGFLLTGAGLVGDLCESAIKRSAGVKDSGGILPGHGGMLDRVDSLLFTAPAFYYYVVLVRGLSPLH